MENYFYVIVVYFVLGFLLSLLVVLFINRRRFIKKLTYQFKEVSKYNFEKYAEPLLDDKKSVDNSKANDKFVK